MTVAQTEFETHSGAIDSKRWPAVAKVPGGPAAATSGAIADRLLRRAAARLPLRLVYPDGTVVGAADQTFPTLVIHRPGAMARRIGRHGLIGFGESYMAGEWSSQDLTGALTVLATVGGGSGAAFVAVAAPIALVRPATPARHQPRTGPAQHR